MWAHEIYGFQVTEVELQEALEAVRGYVVELGPEAVPTLGKVSGVFQNAIDRGRRYERHADIHVDGPES